MTWRTVAESSELRLEVEVLYAGSAVFSIRCVCLRCLETVHHAVLNVGAMSPGDCRSIAERMASDDAEAVRAHLRSHHKEPRPRGENSE